MISRIARLAPIVGATAVLLFLAAGPGTRLALWSFGTGFQLLRWGAYIGFLSIAFGIVALLWRPSGGRRWSSAFAILAGALAVLVPYRWMQQARRVPPIHDITTDTERPPEFRAVLPLRAQAPNPAAYGGPEVAAQQREGYPDIAPLTLAQPAAEVFGRALHAAQEMRWKVIAADSATGRIEATATTPWFGFKDDVVVRITPESGGSRVDVRSVSRVGQSDVGTNAKRIREYLRRLRS